MKVATIISLSLVMGISGSLCAGAQTIDISTNSMARSNADAKKLPLSQANSYAGMWQGTVHTSSGAHRVVLDVGAAPHGNALIASVTTSAQSPFSVLVDSFDVQDRRVRLAMQTAGTMFIGTSNPTRTEIRGTWKQEGSSFPLTLQRVDLTSPADRRASAGQSSDQSDAQSLLAQYSQTPSRNSSLGETPDTPRRTRRTPFFMIGSPHWFPWYEWTPQIGNQEPAYGTYYW